MKTDDRNMLVYALELLESGGAVSHESTALILMTLIRVTLAADRKVSDE